jgi:hypothetical protein
MIVKREKRIGSSQARGLQTCCPWVFRQRHGIFGIVWIATSCIALLIGSALCLAQSTGTGTINGTVTDNTGAVIPGAKVTATLISTGVSRVTTTNDTGLYVIPALRAGTYEITVEAKGFAVLHQQNIVLDSDSTKTVTLSTKVSSSTETITVTTAPPAMETSSGAIGDLISGTQVQDLPLNGRNFTQLLTIGTGASSPQTGTRMGLGQEGNPLLSINGGRITSNAFTFDGVLAMDTGGNRGVNVFPPMEAIQEMQVHTSNYTADIGSYGYGSINLITRSGGSSYHGDLYDVMANSALDATNYFAKSVAPLVDNNFGYDVGGRLLPHAKSDIAQKTFFFWSEAWDKRSGPELTSFVAPPQSTFTALVPTNQERTGNFSDISTQLKNPATGLPYTNNQITNIDPNVQILMNAFIPKPNSLAKSNYVISPRSRTSWSEELIRIDSTVRNSDILMGRFVHDSWNQDQAIMNPGSVANAFPTVPGSFSKPGTNAVAQWTHLFGIRVVNQAEMGFSRNAITQTPGQALQKPSGLTIPSIYGANSPNVIPTVSLGGGYGSFGVNGLTENANNVYTWRDDVTVQSGKHTLKVGTNILRIQKFGFFQYVGEAGTFSFTGSATGNAFADFLTGYAFQYTEQAAVPATYLFSNMYEAYVTDNWKITPRLTVDLGLRDSVFQGAPDGYEKYNKISDFVPSLYSAVNAPTVAANGQAVKGTGNPLNGIITPTNQDNLGLPRSLQQTRNNYGPRLGFAWTPGKAKMTVIRGGYGIYTTWDADTVQAASQNPPFSTSAVLFNVNVENYGSTITTYPAPALHTWNYVKLYPMIEQYSLTVEQELPYSTTLQASYVGNSARHLDQEPNINQPQPRASLAGTNLNAVRPYQGYSTIQYDLRTASGNYNSLQVDLRRRYQNGLQFGADYTWSHAQGQQVGQSQYFNENGPTAYDRRNVLTLNYVYAEPFFKQSSTTAKTLLSGWEFSGITTFQSGLPFTVDLSTDPANVGTSPGSGAGDQAERPNQVAKFTYSPRNVSAYFNSSALASPSAGTFGNESYGAVRGPGLDLWQMNVSKNGNFKQLQVKFEGQFFNIFNHANFNGLGTTYGAATLGTITSALDPREVQFRLKLAF